jgi:hypothetical protein
MIQRALKLTKKQIDTLGKLEAEGDDADTATQDSAEAEDSLRSLTKWQARRFSEIRYQMEGVRALASLELARRIELSEEQRRRLDKLFARHDQEAATIIADEELDGAEIAKQLERLHKDTDTAARRLLSAGQADAWRRQLGILQRREQFENASPGGILRALPVFGKSDRWRVRGADSADDSGHDSYASIFMMGFRRNSAITRLDSTAFARPTLPTAE